MGTLWHLATATTLHSSFARDVIHECCRVHDGSFVIRTGRDSGMPSGSWEAGGQWQVCRLFDRLCSWSVIMKPRLFLGGKWAGGLVGVFPEGSCPKGNGAHWVHESHHGKIVCAFVGSTHKAKQ